MDQFMNYFDEEPAPWAIDPFRPR